MLRRSALPEMAQTKYNPSSLSVNDLYHVIRRERATMILLVSRGRLAAAVYFERVGLGVRVWAASSTRGGPACRQLPAITTRTDAFLWLGCGSRVSGADHLYRALEEGGHAVRADRMQATCRLALLRVPS